ncbi:hypothetical protein GCM10010249_58550 [Streptomyces roseolilacinus]|uniref:Uncharacterized protein n=1 Tax=Streptomyces roseolilacinus TaxID=66904 RepID=A0A918B7T0_9ACTN|nr:hypothetical protein GCM10010249_58550 [Streptomyces roseolilacinus]
MENLPLRWADQACGPDHTKQFPADPADNRPVRHHRDRGRVALVTCPPQVPVRRPADWAGGAPGQ